MDVLYENSRLQIIEAQHELHREYNIWLGKSVGSSKQNQTLELQASIRSSDTPWNSDNLRRQTPITYRPCLNLITARPMD